MISNRDLELIQSYHNNSNDMVEKKILSNVLDELKYRIPLERSYVDGTCPRCNNHLDANSSFCKYCGQSIE